MSKDKDCTERYRVTIGAENTPFIVKVYIDFIVSDVVLVIHKVEDASHLSATQFFEPLTTEFVWETILTLLATVYAGLLKTLVYDNGSQFKDIFCRNLRDP